MDRYLTGYCVRLFALSLVVALVSMSELRAQTPGTNILVPAPQESLDAYRPGLRPSIVPGDVPAFSNGLDAGTFAACFPDRETRQLAGEKRPRQGVSKFDRPAKGENLAEAAPVPRGLRGAIRRVEVANGRKLIALTLDMCEQRGEIAGYDGAIIDYLRANKIKATVFAGGKWLRSHSARAQQLMADPLFEIGNHSEAHRNLRGLSGRRLLGEVLGPQKAYEDLRAVLARHQCLAGKPDAMTGIPLRMGLFRFPFGACNAKSLGVVNDAGLLAVQWDLSTGDPTPATSARAIARQILKNAKPGSIIIAHANGRGYHTAKGLPLALPKLKALGFEFVTISELLASGRPVITQTCYDSRPGDTDRYDRFSRGSKRSTSRRKR